MMENSDEFVCSNDQIMIKGKRSKRQRAPSPCGGKGDQSSSIYSSSPTTSSTRDVVYDSTDQEDEDMAKCLILLAQGDGAARKVSDVKVVERCGGGGSSKRFIEAVRTSSGKAGFYVYECKTCNRTFPSFQALGGHRASHKKPKMMMNLVEDKKIQELVSPTKNEILLDKIMHPSPSACPPPPLSLQMVSKSNVQLLQSANKASKTHECSICGAEFTSGQALGGHMRRHRAAAPPPTPTRATAQISMSSSTTSSGLPEEADEKPRNILALDLNLPAPEDDQRDTKFQFVTPPRSLVLSSPALVDCHN